MKISEDFCMIFIYFELDLYLGYRFIQGLVSVKEPFYFSVLQFNRSATVLFEDIPFCNFTSFGELQFDRQCSWSSIFYSSNMHTYLISLDVNSELRLIRVSTHEICMQESLILTITNVLFTTITQSLLTKLWLFLCIFAHNIYIQHQSHESCNQWTAGLSQRLFFIRQKFLVFRTVFVILASISKLRSPMSSHIIIEISDKKMKSIFERGSLRF